MTYLIKFVYYYLVQDSSLLWTFFVKKPCIHTRNSYTYISTLLFLLHVKITCGYDVIGVAWQTSALSVRVRVPLSAYYIYLTANMLANIVRWLLICLFGWSIIYFSANLTEMFGPIQRASRHLWWTRNGYVVFGFIIMVMGLVMMFGVFDTSWTPTLQQAPVLQ